MAVLPIITAPDPLLKTISEAVTEFDDGLDVLIQNMLDSMYAHKGIGLAAVQIGVAKRVIVIDLQDPEQQPEPPLILINPKILWSSEEKSPYREGCLSVPDQYSDVHRPAEIEVAWQDKTGQEQTLKTGGLMATCIQHEIDHLNGILFIKHLSSLNRQLIMTKLLKKRKLAAR